MGCQAMGKLDRRGVILNAVRMLKELQKNGR